MASVGLILIVLLLGSVGAYLILKPKLAGKSKTRNPFFKLNIRTHFKMLLAFMGLLILLTIAAEFIAPKERLVVLPPKADPYFEEEMHLIEEQIMNREKVDDSFLLEKRVHPVGNALVIQQSEKIFDNPQIYIERKNNDDQTIEEFIYKPALLIDDYDFSELVKVALPIWTDNTISFPTEKSAINFVSFGETTLLAQLTTSSSQLMMSDGYFSTARLPIVHLIVPDELEIIEGNEVYPFYIE